MVFLPFTPFNPDYDSRSLGVFAVLHQIEQCKVLACPICIWAIGFGDAAKCPTRPITARWKFCYAIAGL